MNGIQDCNINTLAYRFKHDIWHINDSLKKEENQERRKRGNEK